MREQAAIFTSISAAPRGMYAPFSQAPSTSSDNLAGPTRGFPVTPGRHTDPDMHEGKEILNDCGAKRASRIGVPTMRCVLPSAMPLALDLPAGRRRNLTVGFHRGRRTAVCRCRSAAVRPAARRWPRNRHRLSGECAGKTEAARPDHSSRRSGRPIRGAGLADLNPSDQKRAAWRCRRGAAGKGLRECQRDSSPRVVPYGWQWSRVPPSPRGQLNAFLAQKHLFEPLMIVEPKISL